MTEQATNKLIHETSPYLRQHADNPVDWQPWGEPAFHEAKQRDVPVFLSIGYATCHWCHVMERESFEDPQVAELLNDRFVSIKVDREERPDIDGQYMKVCQLMTGSGGWPLTVVLTPDKVPFFAATYIPRTSRYGRSGLMELLPRISDLWQDNREALLEPTGRLLDALKRDITSREHRPIDHGTLDKAYRHLERLFDPLHGGFGESPKFPTPHHLNFLLRYPLHSTAGQARDMVKRTLDMMALGGIHDHVGGGFHRYSTDSQWQVPHFEKMLYDQALLITPYLDIFRLTGQRRYLRIVQRTVDYVRESLTNRDGCFMSAQDADSEGKEGEFYVWTIDEIRKVLTSDMAFFTSLYPVRERGNYQDPVHGNASRNIFYIDERSLEQGLTTRSEAALFEQLDAVLNRLKTVRDKRPHPSIDDKVQTDWNGMMIASLASLFTATGDRQALTMAEQAMNGILSHEQRLGTLPHICRKEPPVIPGFLDDYAWLIQALLNLYQAGYHPLWLEHADRLARTLVEQFEHPQRGFSFTSDQHETILFDQVDSFDGATPSGSAVAMDAVNRLARLTGDLLWADVVTRMEQVYSTNIQEHPAGHTAMLTALMDRMSNSPTLIVSCSDSTIAQNNLRPLREGFYPGLDILVRTPQAASLLDRLAPHTQQMTVSDTTRFYLCSGQSCRAPVSDISEVMTVLNQPTGGL